MINERLIARLAYDGEYEKAINCLLDVIISQQKQIERLSQGQNVVINCVVKLFQDNLKLTNEQVEELRQQVRKQV